MASLYLQFSMINAYLYQLQYLYHFIQSYHIHVQYPPGLSYLSRRMDKYGVASNRVYNFWNSPLSRQRGLLPTSQSRGLCGFPSRQSMAQNPHPNVRLMGVIIPPLQRIWKAGILVSRCPSVRLFPSVCRLNRVRSVSSTLLTRSISYLYISSSIFKWNFGKYLKFVTMTLSSFDLGSNMNQ